MDALHFILGFTALFFAAYSTWAYSELMRARALLAEVRKQLKRERGDD